MKDSSMSSERDKERKAEEVARVAQEGVRALVHDALAAGLDIYHPNGRSSDASCVDIHGRAFTKQYLDSVSTPAMALVKRRRDLYVGRCEIAYRSSESKDERVTRHADLLRGCSEGEGAYGMRCGVERKAQEVVDMYERVWKITGALFNAIKTYRILTHVKVGQDPPVLLPTCKTIAEAISRLRNALRPESVLPNDVRARFIQYMIARQSTTTKADKMWGEIKEAVDAHVELRREISCSRLSVDRLSPDLIEKVVEYVDFRSAAACLQTCSELSRIDNLRAMLPHLSIRWIPGVFPHVVAPALESGMCGYVARKSLLHVYTDLVIKGVRSDSPEHARLEKTPVELDMAQARLRDRESEMRRRKDVLARSQRQAEEEEVDATRFRRRLGHECFFKTAIRCEHELVFADTHEVVPSAIGRSVIVPNKTMRKPSAPTSTYTSLCDVPYPSHSSFYVEDLSAHYASRKFKIRATGSAITLPNINGDPSSVYKQTLVAYSRPFEVVSTKKVSTTLRDRARALEETRSKKKQRV